MSPENREKPVKIEVFGIFSETALTISAIRRQKVEENDTEQTQKTAYKNIHRFAGKSRKTGENIGFSGFSRKLQ